MVPYDQTTPFSSCTLSTHLFPSNLQPSSLTATTAFNVVDHRVPVRTTDLPHHRSERGRRRRERERERERPARGGGGGRRWMSYVTWMCTCVHGKPPFPPHSDLTFSREISSYKRTRTTSPRGAFCNTADRERILCCCGESGKKREREIEKTKIARATGDYRIDVKMAQSALRLNWCVNLRKKLKLTDHW